MSTATAASCSSDKSSQLLRLLIVSTALLSPAICSRPSHNDLQPDKETLVRYDPTQSVRLLGRHTFNATVQQEHVDNWIVLFCVDWYEVCQGLWHDYRRMAMHWEEVMGPNASSWQTAAVRFAEVDCATDKALCNENGVETYPWAIHFKGGKFARAWELSRGATSLSGDLSAWIGKVLTGKTSNHTSGITIPEASKTNRLAGGLSGLASHLHELSSLLSWKDPATAAVGYVILAVSVAVLAWIIGTGLELDFKTVLCLAKEANKSKRWPSALLPELPEMPEPRTIVRSSIVL